MKADVWYVLYGITPQRRTGCNVSKFVAIFDTSSDFKSQLHDDIL